MKKAAIALSLASALVSGASNAEIRFNGFASIVAGKASGVGLFGYDDDISFKNESRFALQSTADLGDGLSATAQIMAKGSNDFEAEFEWAYLSYELSDQWTLNAGRLRIPFYRYSDFLDVGYAYRWIRPPKSVYSLDFSTYEGISLLNNGALGSMDYTLQAVYGNYSGDIRVAGIDAASELESVLGVNLTLTYDWLNVRAGYMKADASIDISANPSFAQLSGGLSFLSANFDSVFNTQFASALDNLTVNEDKGSFLGLGFSIDYNDWLIDAEYTELRVDNSFLAQQDSAYISVGKRFNDITVHVTYEIEDDGYNTEALNAMAASVSTMVPLGPDGALIPLGAVPDVAAVNDGVSFTVLDQVDDMRYLSTGLAYAFHPAALFKVDFTRREDNNTNTNENITSIGIDLVF